jgi:DNA-binding LacI/PurR family transcriptional regulator
VFAGNIFLLFRKSGVCIVSIKAITAAAGVSTATVSRVLSHGLHVRPEVREHVMAVVD